MTTVAATAPAKKAKKGIPGFAQLQRIGRSLMLPIASLPAAGLLLRLGQPDMLGADGVAGTFPWMQPVADVFAAAGDALFANLALLFAVGVAIGFAKKADGTTALAAVVGYLVFKGVTTALSPTILGAPAAVTPADVLETAAAGDITLAGSGDYNALVLHAMQTALGGATQQLINYGVLGGIIIGVTAALLFQKYSRVKFPPYLAFFGGRRFVPIVTAGAAVVIGVVLSLIYPAFDWLLNDKIGGFVTGSPVVGGFVFGTVNRLLLPLGLHHLLNSLPWFQFGEYTDANGAAWHGDIARFLHGDPTAGTFMTGFFPIMMFAIPAIALAFVHTAKTKNRKVVAGMMGSAALVAFVTGVTEPLEFAFAYVAYPLYVVHAILTGTSIALVNALGIRDGFNFSAGAIDYLLNFRIAEMPLLLIPIGLGYAAIYYFLFRWAIKRWNLKTPGREDDDTDGSADVASAPEPVAVASANLTSASSASPGGSAYGPAGSSSANGSTP